MEYNIRDRECFIEKPSFIGDMTKTICFLDFRLNLYSIRDGGRVIEYSCIKCRKNSIEVFHSIACPRFSMKNDKVSETYDDIGIPKEVIYSAKNTFEVFLEFIDFISDVDIVICYNWYQTIRILKFYLMELGIDIPKFWLWTIEFYMDRNMNEMHKEFDTLNGFLRAYKTLLVYEYSGCKKMNEKSYADFVKHNFWKSLDYDKIEAFYKKQKKFEKWLFAERRGRSPAPWLAQYRKDIREWRNNVQKVE